MANTNYFMVGDPEVTISGVDNNDPAAMWPVGTRFIGLDGSGFIYVQRNDADVAAADGAPAYWLLSKTYQCTSDVSDSKANLVAGVWRAAVTDQYYGFVQYHGYHGTVDTNGDDDIAANDAVIATGDAVVDSVPAGTAPTYIPLGWATAVDDDANNHVPVWITCGANQG